MLLLTDAPEQHNSLFQQQRGHFLSSESPCLCFPELPFEPEEQELRSRSPQPGTLPREEPGGCAKPPGRAATQRVAVPPLERGRRGDVWSFWIIPWIRNAEPS